MFSHNYELISGDTFFGDWIAVIIGGEPVDLFGGGWQVRAAVRDHATGEKLFDLSVQLGTATITVDGQPVTAATARPHIPASASKTAGPFRGVWDVEIVHPTFDRGSLYRRTVDGGFIRARKDVTRD